MEDGRDGEGERWGGGRWGGGEMFYSFQGHGTSRLHHSVSVSTRLTLPRAAPPRDITYT